MAKISDAHGRCINVTGPMIKEKALQIAKDLGNTEFKTSYGRLLHSLKGII
jgi:hypothetical protein